MWNARSSGNPHYDNDPACIEFPVISSRQLPGWGALMLPTTDRKAFLVGRLSHAGCLSRRACVAGSSPEHVRSSEMAGVKDSGGSEQSAAVSVALTPCFGGEWLRNRLLGGRRCVPARSGAASML